MSRDLLTRASDLAESLAVWAMVRMRRSRISMTRTKQHEADVVTDVDLSIEMWVRETIERTFPDHGFIGEEFGTRPGGGCTWYCDPIDGTTNFATGLGWHSFSLAMVDEDGPAVGVVADPRSEEVFCAVRGRGAHLNGQRLQVPARSSLAGSVLMTELAGARPWPGMLELIEALGDRHVTTRVMGSSALSLTGLAAGRGQAGIIGSFGPVDLLASVLIAHEAGLEVLDEQGRSELFPERGGILVAAPGLSGQVHELWRACVAAAS